MRFVGKVPRDPERAAAPFEGSSSGYRDSISPRGSAAWVVPETFRPHQWPWGPRGNIGAAQTRLIIIIPTFKDIVTGFEAV